jgi:hypothetical protein
MKACFIIAWIATQTLALSNETSKTAVLLTRGAPNPERTAVFGGFLFLFSTATFFPAAWVAYSVKRYLAEGKTVSDATVGEAFVAVVGTVLGGATAFLWGQGILHFADAVTASIYNPSDPVFISVPFDG